MHRDRANKPVAPGTRLLLLAAALSVVGGCSRGPSGPSDYVPDEGPTEAWIIATPNPVPAGRGPRKTIVNWHTGDGSPGQVYVSIGGGPERLFSTNPSHQEATINSNDEYEFRLYTGTDHTKPLASARVTRDRAARARLPRDRLNKRDGR